MTQGTSAPMVTTTLYLESMQPLRPYSSSKVLVSPQEKGSIDGAVLDMVMVARAFQGKPVTEEDITRFSRLSYPVLEARLQNRIPSGVMIQALNPDSDTVVYADETGRKTMGLRELNYFFVIDHWVANNGQDDASLQ